MRAATRPAVHTHHSASVQRTQSGWRPSVSVGSGPRQGESTPSGGRVEHGGRDPL